MVSEDLVEELDNSGILKPTSEDEYRLSENFITTFEEMKTSVVDQKEDDIVQSFTGPRSPLKEIFTYDPIFVSKYLAVEEYLEDRSFDRLVQLVFVVDQIIDPQVRSEGAPTAFLPVRGQHLQAALDLYQNAIVYGWREDCDPCDIMRQELDDILKSPIDNIALFAVYGPRHAAILQKEYDMTAAPTILFVANGTVDARLTGAKYKEAIETEIQNLQSLAEE